MNHMRRNSFLSLSLLALGAVLLVCSCASERGYVRSVLGGSCVDVSGTDVYLSIGSKDGATVGQELNVYKVVRSSMPKYPLYNRVLTGKVKITQIIDEHFSKAKLISGTAEKNNIVELITPEKR